MEAGTGPVEKRKYRRHPVFFRGMITVGTTGSQSAVLLDVSEGGCQAACALSLRPEDEVVVRIEPPQVDPIVIPRAQIRWVKGSVFGAQFQDVPDGLAPILTRLLWSLPPLGQYPP